jgi:flagellar motor switch protein FliM
MPPRWRRYLTQIEVDLIEEFLIVLLEEWCGQWVTESEVEPQIIGHEIVASVMQICEHDAVMFSLAMDASIRGSNGKITICVPFIMIEDAIKKMKARQGYELQASEQDTVPSWRNGYEQIPVKGLVELSMGQVDVQVAKDWKVGTVLPLEHDAMQSAILKLAGQALFTCEVGIDNDHRAIKIHQKVEKEKDLWPTIQ